MEIVRVHHPYAGCQVELFINVTSPPLGDLYRTALGFADDIHVWSNITESVEVPWQISNTTSFPDADLNPTLPGGADAPTSITNSSYGDPPPETTITAHYLNVKNATGQTIRQPVRDPFLEAIEQEQWHTFGINVSTWGLHEVWGVGNECFVHLRSSSASIQEPEHGVFAIGPADVAAALDRAGFMLNKIGFMQLMLANLIRNDGQNYTLNRVWTTNFILDNWVSTTCENVEELSLPPKQWAVDFGNGTHMDAAILEATSQNVLLQDTLVVTNNTISRSEEEILMDGLLCYNVFNIHAGTFSPVTTSQSFTAEGGSGTSDNWGWGWRIHLWDGEFTLQFTGLTFDVVTSLDLEGRIRWKFEWFRLKYAEAWMKLTASLAVNMTVAAEFTQTYDSVLCSKTLFRWNTTYTFWVGPVPVYAELIFTPIATLAVGLSYETNIVCGVEAVGSLKAGAGWKRGGGWRPIYDAEMHLDRTGPDLEDGLTVDVDAWVQPSVKFRLALMFYEAAGPFVEFEPYIRLSAHCRYNGTSATWTWWWEIHLGFNVNVGITFSDVLKKVLKLSDYTRTLWNRVLWMCVNCEPTEEQDIALVEVRVPERRRAFIGENVSIAADVVNLGWHPETVNASLYIRPDGETEWTRVAGPVQVADMPTGNWTTFEFTWTTDENLASGNYTLNATATIVGSPEVFANKTDWMELEIQDVTVESVSADRSAVVEGVPVDIQVTVRNVGTDIVYALPVSVLFGGSLIGDLWCEHTHWAFNLAPDSSRVLNFSWDTTGVANGTYLITANATVLPYETGAHAPNTGYDGEVTVVGRLSADISLEYGEVDILDVVAVALAFGAARVTDPYDPHYGLYWTWFNDSIHPSTADVNRDQVIDIFDIVKVALSFGESYGPPLLTTFTAS
jgi:hypothetical protein